MCSVHRLLLNCILFLHLAPQLTLWSGRPDDGHSEIARRNWNAGGDEIRWIHNLDPFIRLTRRSPSCSHNLNQNEITPDNSQRLANPSSNSLNSSKASSSTVNSASNQSNQSNRSSPANPKAFKRLKPSNDYLNQKLPCMLKPSIQSSSQILSQPSNLGHALSIPFSSPPSIPSNIQSQASISSVIKQSNNRLPSPDPTISSLPNLQLSTLFIVFELFAHHFNVKTGHWWINRPVGAYASSDTRAHRKFFILPLLLFWFLYT